MAELENRKWELFARAYIEYYGNARQAAIAAGYSPRSARQQGSVLSDTPAIRARIAELAAEGDTSSLSRMEHARDIVYKRLLDIAETGDGMAAVQAGRVLGDLLGMGESGARVKAQQDKIDLERERLQMAREALKAAEDGKNPSIVVNGELISAIMGQKKS